jgi:prepilin-type N-terminal cleavage/methylation domain-containing protein
MRKAQGFTLMELVVAVAIMLIIGAAVTPMLLSHIKDAKVASVNETLLNTKTAFDSYFASEEGSISDTTILDNVIAAGFLGQTPSIDGLAAEMDITSAEVGDYDVYSITCDVTADEYTASESVFLALDEQIDDGDLADGIMSVDATDTTDGYFTYQIAKILQ